MCQTFNFSCWELLILVRSRSCSGSPVAPTLLALEWRQGPGDCHGDTEKEWKHGIMCVTHRRMSSWCKLRDLVFLSAGRGFAAGV